MGASQSRFLLVVPPFQGVTCPALGVSLLKATLTAQGYAADLVYLNLRFAERIGVETYAWISEHTTFNGMLGEYIFASLLSERTAHDLARYAEDVLGAQAYTPVAGPASPDRHLLALLQRCIQAAAAWVYDDALPTLLAYEPWMVGFTSTFQQNCASLLLMKALQQARPTTLTILGGANCEGEMGAEVFARFPELDYVGQGECDQSFVALMQDYGVPRVEMVDNILDMQYFRTVLPELAAQPKADIFYEVKANLSKEQVQMLAQAQVKWIQPGIESLSDQTLTLMRRGTTALQNIQLLKWCATYGIRVGWSYLYGFPGEDEAELEDLAPMLEALTHLEPPVGAGTLHLDRFSPYFTAPEDYGLEPVEPLTPYQHLYPFPPAALQRLALAWLCLLARNMSAATLLWPESLRVLAQVSQALYSLFCQVPTERGHLDGMWGLVTPAVAERPVPPSTPWLPCAGRRPALSSGAHLSSSRGARPRSGRRSQ